MSVEVLHACCVVVAVVVVWSGFKLGLYCCTAVHMVLFDLQVL